MGRKYVSEDHPSEFNPGSAYRADPDTEPRTRTRATPNQSLLPQAEGILSEAHVVL